jgi:hypothetical protein
MQGQRGAGGECDRFVESQEQRVATSVRVLRRTDSLTLAVSVPELQATQLQPQPQPQQHQPPGRDACAQGPFYGAKTAAGHNSTQEDAYIVIPGFLSVSANPAVQLCSSGGEFEEQLHLFAIYDGHGGRVVSDFCASFLHLYLSEELSAVPSGLVHRAPSQALQQALSRAFVRADQEVQRQQRAKAGEGSTALLVLLGTQHLWTAHCGEAPHLPARARSRLSPAAGAAPAAAANPCRRRRRPQATPAPCCAAPASRCA